MKQSGINQLPCPNPTFCLYSNEGAEQGQTPPHVYCKSHLVAIRGTHNPSKTALTPLLGRQQWSDRFRQVLPGSHHTVYTKDSSSLCEPLRCQHRKTGDSCSCPQERPRLYPPVVYGLADDRSSGTWWLGTHLSWAPLARPKGRKKHLSDPMWSLEGIAGSG